MNKKTRLLVLLCLMFLDVGSTLLMISKSDGAIVEANPIPYFLWNQFGYFLGSFLSVLFTGSLLAFFTYVELIPEHKLKPGWPTSSAIFFVFVLAGYAVVFYNTLQNLIALKQYGFI